MEKSEVVVDIDAVATSNLGVQGPVYEYTPKYASELALAAKIPSVRVACFELRPLRLTVDSSCWFAHSCTPVILYFTQDFSVRPDDTPDKILVQGEWVKGVSKAAATDEVPLMSDSKVVAERFAMVRETDLKGATALPTTATKDLVNAYLMQGETIVTSIDVIAFNNVNGKNMVGRQGVLFIRHHRLLAGPSQAQGHHDVGDESSEHFRIWHAQAVVHRRHRAGSPKAGLDEAHPRRLLHDHRSVQGATLMAGTIPAPACSSP